MKIIWSPLALERVNEIADYITEDEFRSLARTVKGQTPEEDHCR